MGRLIKNVIRKTVLASTIGAGLVGYGEFGRTLQQQMDMVCLGRYNVKDTKFAGGAKGDGVTNDTAAFVAASAALMAAGGGTYVIPPGNYLVGSQTFANGAGKGYSYLGENPVNISNCTRHVHIECAGAILKLASGLKYGSFDPVTGAAYIPSAMPFLNKDYVAGVGDVFNIVGNSSVEIDPVEIDGNATGVVLGGQWGDTGYQVRGSGLRIEGNKQVFIRNPKTHHCCLDGIYVGFNGLTENSPIYPHTIINPQSEYNGRQGISWVGGTNLQVIGGSFSYTGKNGKVSSLPMCGIDIEPSASVCKNGTFIGVSFIDNAGGNPGSYANRPDIRFINCKFVGVTTYAWYGFGHCDGCTFEGPSVIFAGSKFAKCTLTMVPATTQTVYGGYAVIAGSAAGIALLDGCKIISGTQSAIYTPGNTVMHLNNSTVDGTGQTFNSDMAGSVLTGLITIIGAELNAGVNYAYANGLLIFQCTLYDGTTYNGLYGTGATGLKLGSDGTMSAKAGYKVNGVKVMGAQQGGYGVPLNPAQITNFNGATASLAQCSGMIAKLVTDLKSHGLLGA